jgi:hypothetical protein
MRSVTPAKDDGVLQRLAGALAQVWRHGVGGIAQQHHSPRGIRGQVGP